LAEHPVVNVGFVAENLAITGRAARDLYSKAQAYGILRKIGSDLRNVFYQADEMSTILNEVSDIKNIQRLFM
jgi:hypothetical protein